VLLWVATLVRRVGCDLRRLVMQQTSNSWNTVRHQQTRAGGQPVCMVPGLCQLQKSKMITTQFLSAHHSDCRRAEMMAANEANDAERHRKMESKAAAFSSCFGF
jgi:hypothetical protein